MKDNKRPNQPKKNGRVVGIIIVVVIVLIGLGIYSHYKQPNTGPSDAKSNIQTPNQTMLPQPKTLSNFNLTDDNNKPFNNENLKGHWTIVLFGYSHCGDVCPISLTELNKTFQQLQTKVAANLMPQVLFISVDPKRDTPEVLNRYVKNFNPNFIAATGDADNLNLFVKEMGVYYSKKPSTDPNVYGMDHSSQVFLFNPKGEWVGFLSFPFQSTQLASVYQALLNGQVA